MPHSTEWTLLAVSVILILASSCLGMEQIFTLRGQRCRRNRIWKILANKWYVDELYDAIVNKPLRAISVFLNNVLRNLRSMAL
jgi:NADH-quinone oxidoreductase subunit L